MKKLFIVALSAGLAFSCGASQDDNSTQKTKSTMVPEVSQHSESVSDQNAETVNVVVTNDNAADEVDVKATNTLKLNRLLSKNINAKTFSEDMKIIEESGLYDSLVCASFRQRFSKDQFSLNKNSLSITYKQALEATKQGIESARRIERIN